MATIDSTTLIRKYAEGDPLKVVTWIMRTVTSGDVVDVSAEFGVAAVAAILTIKSQVAANCPLTNVNQFAIPSGIAAGDAGWLIAWGSAK